MKTLLLLIFLLFSALLSADTIDLMMRVYDVNGKAVQPAVTSLYTDEGSAEPVFSASNDIWQHWKLIYPGHRYPIKLSHPGDSMELFIDVHPDFRKRLRILVIDRLQFTGKPHVIKVNHLTCMWTGSMAKPSEYQYRNPFDGEQITAIPSNCVLPPDTSAAKIHFVSDSVMLLTCGRSGGVFIKYFIGADGKLSLHPSGFECTEFSSRSEETLYRNLTDGRRIWYVKMDGNLITLSDDRCIWVFRFSR